MSKAQPGVTRRAIRRLANPAMVSSVSFGITFVAWLLSVYPLILRGEAAITWSTASTWLLVVTVGQLAIFAVLAAAKRLWLSHPWSRKHPSVALWTIVFAVLLGLIVAALAAQLFFEQRDSLLIGFEYFPFGVAVMIAAGAASVVVHEHREALRTLRRTRAALEASMENGEVQMVTERERIAQKAHAVLDEALERMNGPRAELITYLNEASEHIIRPLSHRLVAERRELQPTWKPLPAPRWREVFSVLARKSLIAPKVLSAAVVFLAWRLTVSDEEMVNSGNVSSETEGLALSIDLESFGQSLLQLFTVFVSTLVVSLVVKHLTNRVLTRISEPWQWATQLGSIFTVALASQTAIALLFLVSGAPIALVITPVSAGVIVLSVALVTLFVGAVRGVTAAQRDIENQLIELNRQLRWHLSRLNQEIWHQRRQWGLLLHGRLRSALIATAMQLQHAESTGGDDDHETMRTRLGALRNLLTARTEPPRPKEALQQIVDLWRGTCEIHCECDDSTIARLSRDHVAAQCAVDVIDEACSNAITHGDAKNIRVKLELSEQSVEIEVRNDGRVPLEVGSPGLGTSFLSEVTIAWDINFFPGGATLSATLPLK